MPYARVLCAILVLLALVFGVRQGLRLVRSTPAQVRETLHIRLNQTTNLIIGFRGALVELPFLFLSLLMLYLGHPFKHQP